MPQISSIVKDVHTSTIHPISEQVVNYIIRELAVSQHFDNRIYINSDNTSGSSSFDAEMNPLLKENRMTVAMTYSLNPVAVKWPTANFSNMISGTDSIRHLNEPKPIFYDARSQTVLVEKDTPSLIKLECKMTFTDRVAAAESLSKLTTRYNDGEMMTVTDLVYEYPVPENIYVPLYGTFTMADGGFTGGFLEYMDVFSGHNITTQINRHAGATGKKQFVVKKQNCSVLVAIEFGQEMLSAEFTNKSADLYSVVFTLSIQFARTHMLVLTYPIIINNTLVPNEMLNLNMDDYKRKLPEVHPYFSYDNYLKAFRAKAEPNQLVNVPFYDDWCPPSTSATEVMEYKPFLSCAFTLSDIDNASGVTVLDIENDLPVPLAPQVIAVLKAQGDKSLGFGEAINVAVYMNDVMVEPTTLTLIGGTVLTVRNRMRYAIYRLVISEYKGKPYGVHTTARIFTFNIIAKKQ